MTAKTSMTVSRNSALNGTSIFLCMYGLGVSVWGYICRPGLKVETLVEVYIDQSEY